MKLAAVLIVSFAVVAIVFAENDSNMKHPKLPASELDHAPANGQPRNEDMHQEAQRRGGKGKDSQPQQQGWGWGGPPVGGWGPPPPAPMVIPIPMMGWGGSMGGYGR